MTGMIIFLSIVLFFVLLFISSITLYVEYKDEISIKIGFWGIKFFDVFKDDSEEKSKKAKTKKKKKAEKAEIKPESENSSKEQNEKEPPPPSEETPKQKSKSKNDFSETVALALEVAKTTLPKIKDILLKFRITSLVIDMKVGQDDAHSTAMSYSYYSMGVYQSIAVLKSNIKVKIKRINIMPDFTNSEITHNISFKLKIRLYVIIFGFVGIIVSIIKNKEIMKRWKK